MPGSPGAVEAGCICPVIDNHHGDGRPVGDGLQWVMDERCPLHGDQTERNASAITYQDGRATGGGVVGAVATSVALDSGKGAIS